MTVATLTRQCWLFAIGSSLFAIATVPGFLGSPGAGAANWLCFVGSWFFTTAGWMQLRLSGQEWTNEWLCGRNAIPGDHPVQRQHRLASVVAHAVLTERRLVWAPDATGSVAFLVSGVFGWWPSSIGIGRLALKSVTGRRVGST